MKSIDKQEVNQPRRNDIIVVMAVLTAIFCLIVWYRLGGQALPILHNDSYQYLSVAKNALTDFVGYTSLVHFDAERSFGVIPAPLVTFPAGFSLLVATLSKLGLSLTNTALLVNVLVLIFTMWVIGYAGIRLRLNSLILSVALSVFALNSHVSGYATGVLTEAVFTFLVLSGVVLVAIPPSHKVSNTIRRAAWAGLFIGLAYHVRYAALFVFVGLTVVAAISLLVGNKHSAKNYLIASVIAVPLMAAGLFRNYLLVGNWRGGNEKIVSHPFTEIALTSVRSFDNLILGERASHFVTFLHAIFFLIVIAGAVIIIFRYAQKKEQAQLVNRQIITVGIELAIVVLTYCGCMFYAGLTTVISYGTRMFFPILPLAILALSCGAQALQPLMIEAATRSQKVLAVLGTAMLLLYSGLNLTTATMPFKDRTDAIRDMFIERNNQGYSASDVLSKLPEKERVIIANDGQAVGYVLQTQTLSMVSKNFSNIEWDELMLRKSAAQYKAGAVVIVKPELSQFTDPDMVPSHFVRDLIELHYPTWLLPVFQSSRLIVYRVQFDSKE